MNKPSKLGGRRSSEAEAEMKRTTTKTKTKTKPSPRRSPLTDINGGSRPPLSGSGEAPRSGCFRFLLSNSSSSSSKNPIAQSNPTLSTPRSAPPNPRTLPSRNPRNPPKQTTRPRGSKNPSPELSFEVGFQCHDATTPEKAKEPEAKPSLISPKSGTRMTPPIHASISPEVPCASSVAATPVCFAAGHVVAGVHDRRKCRPRGILAVVGRDDPAESAELREKRFDESSPPPPLAGASIHWLSSSPADPSSSFSSYSKAHCEAEASVNWLLSPREDGEESIHKEEELILPKCSFSAANFSADLWRFSHSDASPLQTTPSSGFGIQKTPTTDSSLSPFSMILKRASKSSMPKLPRVQQESGSGGYRYGSNAERSPFSGESSWTNNTCNINSTAKQAPNISVHEVDSISEVLESISLSSKRMDSDEASLLGLSGHSFQFGRQEAPFDSIDLSCFRTPFCDDRISGRKASSATRISWREGLVSRIFEMGELDCCQWLSDDEDEFDHERISLLKDGVNREAACGFGSIEFTCSGSEHKEGDGITSSGLISCSEESISTEGAELISSDDSNWTLFYKNNLFAV